MSIVTDAVSVMIALGVGWGGEVVCFRDVDWAYKAGYELRSALQSSENKKEKCGFVARTWKSRQLLNAIMDLWGLGDFYWNTCRAKTLHRAVS